MRVAGVELPAGAVAGLALCLRDAGATDLSQRVGIAVDTNQRELGLDSRERPIVLRAIWSGPEALVALRLGLIIDELLRQRATMRRLTVELQRRGKGATRRRNAIYTAACHTFERARESYSRTAANFAHVVEGSRHA